MFALGKIPYRLRRLVSGLRYRTQRRFTPMGLAALGGFGFTALLCADVDQTLGYQVFPLIGSLLLVSTLWVWPFRSRFSVARTLPRFATAGIPMQYRVRVRNESPHTQAGLTLLEDLADPRPTFEQYVAARQSNRKRMRSFARTRTLARAGGPMAQIKARDVPEIPPGSEVEVRMELVPNRRGLLQFTGATLARTDPLGLVRAFSHAAAPQSLLVLPRRYPLPPLALPGAARYQRGGVALASAVGQSEEFISLRDYRRGDPLRHIHWRSWAKTDKPIVKEFQDEYFVRHALVLDTFVDQPQSEAFEAAVSVAASFACSLQTQESLLDLLFVGPKAYCFTVGRGVAHTDQMLEILAAVQPASSQGFEVLEQLVLNHSGVVSGCICVLLAWDERRESLVKRLRQMGIPVLVILVVEPGAGPGPDTGPLSDDPGSFHVLDTDHIQAGLARLGRG